MKFQKGTLANTSCHLGTSKCNYLGNADTRQQGNLQCILQHSGAPCCRGSQKALPETERLLFSRALALITCVSRNEWNEVSKRIEENRKQGAVYNQF